MHAFVNPSRTEGPEHRGPTKWNTAADAQLTAGFTAAVVVGGFASLLRAPSLGLAAAGELALAVVLWWALRDARPWAAVAGIARSAATLLGAAAAFAIGASLVGTGGRWTEVILLVLVVLALPVVLVVGSEVGALGACVSALRAEREGRRSRDE